MIDRLIEKIKQTDNPSVVGLDTNFDYLPDELRAGVADLRGAAQAITGVFHSTAINIRSGAGDRRI